jgi:beta-phosphoglucomutase-like phosphatase (HAD superfamily)
VPTRFQGAIFDVDGVLVDSPHEKAWRESLRELMEGEWSHIRDQTTWSPERLWSTSRYPTSMPAPASTRRASR